MSRFARAVRALCIGVAATAVFAAPALAQDKKSIKVGFVTYLSGPASGPFGVPAKIAAEAIVESLNAGKVPAPYQSVGIAGMPIELVIIDENGGATKQVSEFRTLVQRQNVDVVIGYIGSGDCLAIAPVADELKKITVLLDCGTPRVFEESSFKYVFRTRPHATMDAIAATLYLAEAQPNLKRVTGINQNYAFGQDSWNDFEASVKAIKPDAEILGSQMPKFGAGQYGAEISALLSSNADVIHSSLWGGDLEAFMIQAQPRNLFKKPQLVLVAGEPYLHRLPGRIPDGTIVGARGTNGVFAPESPLKQWLVETYKSKSGGLDPNYPAYSTAQAFLGVKAAFEKAKGKNAATPSSEDVVAAFEKLTFDSPSGKVAMNLGKGHQAVMGTAYGVTKTENGVIKVVNIKYFDADKVTPPEGVASLDWIRSGFKKTK